jgi:hypothetical protein
MYLVDDGETVLYEEPSESARPLVRFRGGIGNHLMTKREIRGDWMRVRLEVHGYRCPGEPPWAGVDVTEGWVRWRRSDGASRVFHIGGLCR